MLRLTQSYRLLNALSFDVVAGAFACSLFFFRVFSVVIRPWELIALCLTVWIIYTTDHLRDSQDIQSRASTVRHQFHQRHYRTLLIVTVLVLILDVVVVIFIAKQVLIWGLVLAAFVLVYLLIHKSLRFFKEIFIAILYTSGVVLPSLSKTEIDLNASHYILILHFSILALINLLMFSWFDRELDLRDRQNSFTTLAGEKATRITIWFLLGVQVLLTLIQLHWGKHNGAVIFLCLMGLLLFVIFAWRKTFGYNDYYRLIGDAVFIVPIFYRV